MASPQAELSRASSNRKLVRAGQIAFLPTGILQTLLGPMLPFLIARWAMNDTQVAWKSEFWGIISCPCHGSKFYVFEADKIPGAKIEGPAPRPLPWLEVSLSDGGDLIVDRSKQIEPNTFKKV